MPLIAPSPQASSAENYARLAALTSEVDKVAAISQVAYDASAVAKGAAAGVIELQRQILAVGYSLSGGLSDEIVTRTADIAAVYENLHAAIAAATEAALLAALTTGRPGLGPSGFLDRDGVPLDPGATVVGPLGRAYRMSGAGVVRPRVAIVVDPDGIHVLRARYWRLEDSQDPNNHAVDVGAEWLDQDGGIVGTTLVRRDRDLRVQDGPRGLTIRVPSLAGDRTAVRPPAGAVAWRPYLRTYGADGATAVDILGADDATYAGVYAPDVSALADRLGTIEGQIGAGLPLTAPRLPSYPVGSLPAAGNRGRQAWASDGRARQADGTLEAANAGSGVSVEDNGTTWVLPGTNQQVQA